MTLNDRLCGVAMALAVTLLYSAAADAGAAQQKTQAPGYYRMMLGDIEVTVLSDGTFPMEVNKMLTHVTPKQLDTALASNYLKEPVETSVNAFLINTGAKLVLVDTGCGISLGPTVYVVESKGEELILWGDLMHVAAAQFAEPSPSPLTPIPPWLSRSERRCSPMPPGTATGWAEPICRSRALGTYAPRARATPSCR